MPFFYQKKFKVGILGGGQLGRMFIQDAVNFNLNCCVLDPDVNAPCSSIADEFVCGSFNDYNTVLNFGKNKDIITIEIENVNTDALFELQRQGKKIFPQPEVISIIRDKGIQKEFYKNNGIPSGEFELIENKSNFCDLKIKFPFVQKLRTGGYDGKGVFIVKNEDDFNATPNVPSVLERLVEIEREISVIVARNQNGDVKSFPVVDMEFNAQANLVEYLFSPSEIPINLQDEAKKIAEKVIVSLNMVGILAVEMFLTKSGEILVNESAPRAHNSGHHTIEGNMTSQYNQLLRAILNLPLGNTTDLMPSVMINLLGEPGYEGDAIYEGLENVLQMPGVFLHLYGKKTTKPFRKMGHITVVNKNAEMAKRQAKLIKQILKVKA